MGSAESEVTESTADIVLEAAYFQPTRIRRTRRALGLASESSYRFERGIDMLGMPDALTRAIDLIHAVAGGEMREPPIDLWPEPQKPRSVFLRPARVNHLLGVPVPRKEIEQLLSAVGRGGLSQKPSVPGSDAPCGVQLESGPARHPPLRGRNRLSRGEGTATGGGAASVCRPHRGPTSGALERFAGGCETT